MPAAREFFYILIIKLQLHGSTIGRNFNESGQIGVSMKLSTFLCIIGPFNTILLETDPNELEIIIPSPHNLLMKIFLSSLSFFIYNSILTNAGFAPRLISISQVE